MDCSVTKQRQRFTIESSMHMPPSRLRVSQTSPLGSQGTEVPQADEHCDSAGRSTCMMSVGYHDLAASCSTRQRVLRLCHVLPTSSRRRTDPRIDCAKYGTRRCAFQLWLRKYVENYSADICGSSSRIGLPPPPLYQTVPSH